MCNRKSINAILVIVALMTVASAAMAEGIRKRVRFPRGSTSTVLKNSVIRGDIDTYLLGARKGQTMTVRITSLEDNAVFLIYKPGGKEALEGAGEGEDATEWSGELPATGDYVIEVGGTRGNATYKLEVKIK
jgi:hypothetical protein